VALGSEAGLGPHLPPVGGRHLPQPQWRHSPASSLSHRKREGGGRNSRWEESGRGRERRRVWRCGRTVEERDSNKPSILLGGGQCGLGWWPDAGIGEWVWRGQETKKNYIFFLLETLSIAILWVFYPIHSSIN
jgi:hypothetical protein